MKTRPTDDEMVAEVINWLNAATIDDQIAFENSSYNELYQYHHSLGQDIRNNFKLWQYEWEPVLVEGIDNSSEHPDAISMRVIQKVWEKVVC